MTTDPLVPVATISASSPNAPLRLFPVDGPAPDEPPPPRGWRLLNRPVLDLGPVDVSAVVYSDDEDRASSAVDSIEHAVRPTTGTEKTHQVVS